MKCIIGLGSLKRIVVIIIIILFVVVLVIIVFIVDGGGDGVVVIVVVVPSLLGGEVGIISYQMFYSYYLGMEPPVQWVPGLSPRVRCSGGVTLTPHPLLVPRSKIE